MDLRDEVNWHLAAISAMGFRNGSTFGSLAEPTYSRGRRWDSAGDTGGRGFSASETLIIGIASGIIGSGASITMGVLESVRSVL